MLEEPEGWSKEGHRRGSEGWGSEASRLAVLLPMGPLGAPLPARLEGLSSVNPGPRQGNRVVCGLLKCHKESLPEVSVMLLPGLPSLFATLHQIY